MRKIYHPELNAGRWFTFSLTEQVGNVGSEYERALKWKQAGDSISYAHASGRLLELIELTIADKRWKIVRRAKLMRLKQEMLKEICMYEHPGKGKFHEYFLRVALAARKNR